MNQENEQLHDRVTLLEEQIRTCTEDFRTEEKDRKHLSSRCQDLEMEVETYKEQVSQLLPTELILTL